jgi:hypothetical protein
MYKDNDILTQSQQRYYGFVETAEKILLDLAGDNANFEHRPKNRRRKFYVDKKYLYINGIGLDKLQPWIEAEMKRRGKYCPFGVIEDAAVRLANFQHSNILNWYRRQIQ